MAATTTISDVGRDYAERIQKAARASENEIAKSVGGKTAVGSTFRLEVDEILRDVDRWQVPATGQPISAVQKREILSSTDEALGLEQGTMEELHKSFSNQIKYQAALATLLNTISFR